MIRVEVVYGTADRQKLVALDVKVGCSVKQAIEVANMQQWFPEMKIDGERLGIFSKRTTLDAILRDGDRVEIYRPLICDPKASRKSRAKAGA